MEKRLFRVKVDLYVMAEDEAEACAAATRARFDIFECTARKADYVAPEWNYAIPFNANDERTCAEIMAEKLHSTHPDTLLSELPAYVETAMREFNADNQSSQRGQPHNAPRELASSDAS